jgi:hypothetical protein
VNLLEKIVMKWEFEVNLNRNEEVGSKKYQFLEKVQGGGGGA